MMLSRRDFLKLITLATGVAFIPKLSVWAGSDGIILNSERGQFSKFKIIKSPWPKVFIALKNGEWKVTKECA